MTLIDSLTVSPFSYGEKFTKNWQQQRLRADFSISLYFSIGKITTPALMPV